MARGAGGGAAAAAMHRTTVHITNLSALCARMSMLPVLRRQVGRGPGGSRHDGPGLAPSLTRRLCRPCHIAKGAEDRPEVAHGLYMYEYYRCRCDLCRAANAVASARKRRLYGHRSRASALEAVFSTAARSGVAQSAEHPAVNRVVESSSLSPRAESGGQAWDDLGERLSKKALNCEDALADQQATGQQPDAPPAEVRGINRSKDTGPGSAGDQLAFAGLRVAYERSTCFPATRCLPV